MELDQWNKMGSAVLNYFFTPYRLDIKTGSEGDVCYFNNIALHCTKNEVFH